MTQLLSEDRHKRLGWFGCQFSQGFSHPSIREDPLTKRVEAAFDDCLSAYQPQQPGLLRRWLSITRQIHFEEHLLRHCDWLIRLVHAVAKPIREDTPQHAIVVRVVNGLGDEPLVVQVARDALGFEVLAWDRRRF
jgi:hypothetical protein